MQLFVRDLQGSTVTLEAEQQQQVGQLKDRRRWERWIFFPKNWGDIDFKRILMGFRSFFWFYEDVLPFMRILMGFYEDFHGFHKDF